MTKFSLTLILSVACNTALAAGEQGIPMGPFQVIPEIEVTLKYDDNVTLADGKNLEEIDSFVTILRPQVAFLMRQRAQTYSVILGTEVGFYADSSDDDYIDVFVKGNANWRLARSADLSVGAHYMRGHDQRGSTDRGIQVGDEIEPDTWDEFGINGLFQYGEQERIGFDAEIGYTTRSYKDFIREEKLDDSDRTDLTGRVYYRVRPKTRLFFEASYSMIEYQEDFATSNLQRADSDESNYSIGATWTATAKTKGTAQVGYLKREFDSDANDDRFEDFSGTNWKVAVEWKPMPRSIIDIYTSRYTSDTTGIHTGGLQDTQGFSVNWRHNWMPRISTMVGLYFAQTDYPGGTGRTLGLDERSDDIINFDLGASYQFIKWASLTAGVSFTERDSNLDSDDYDRNIYYLTLKAALK